jgi:hypothetical protein
MTDTGSIKLVRPNGSTYKYKAEHEPLAAQAGARFESRIAFAAAHVVLDPLRTAEPLTHPVIDWDATLAYREYLWSLGFGVAEAMDTAQRGMGLDWPLALELIKRSTAVANARGALLASGAGTDHLPAGKALALQDVKNAYLEQCEAIEAVGGRIILMASRALVAVARNADDYTSVYAMVLAQVRQPVILHWLGPMFDPALEGYWARSTSPRRQRTASTSSAQIARRSTASRSLCSTRTSKSPCASNFLPECGCIPATTSTMTA